MNQPTGAVVVETALLFARESVPSPSLLAEAVARGTNITRFEVIEPSLEEIFITTVKSTPEFVEAGGKVHA